MIEYNIYSGYKNELYYQFTGHFKSLSEAETFAQAISEIGIDELGYSLDDCCWLAVETEKDNIPLDKRVEIGY